jgi:hypothetical protein
MRPESAEELYRQGRLSTEARTWLREHRPNTWRYITRASVASSGTHTQIIPYTHPADSHRFTQTRYGRATGEHSEPLPADSHRFTQAGGGGITGEYRVCPNHCYPSGTHCHCTSPASNVDR